MQCIDAIAQDGGRQQGAVSEIAELVETQAPVSLTTNDKAAPGGEDDQMMVRKGWSATARAWIKFGLAAALCLVGLSASALTTTTTVLTSSINPSQLGQSTTLKATVTPSTATGTVTFKDGTTTLGTHALGTGGVLNYPTTFSTVRLAQPDELGQSNERAGERRIGQPGEFGGARVRRTQSRSDHDGRNALMRLLRTAAPTGAVSELAERMEPQAP